MIHIVTDSTAGVSQSLAEEHGIEIVPLRVIFGDTIYCDGVDITPAQFYRMLASSPTLPTTSQPPIAEFREAFERATADGDEALAILISSKLSGTVASAVAAQGELPGARITVFDSLTTSASQAFMVEHAATRAASGATMDEIVRDLQTLRDRAQIFFTIETFEYLQKGGRVGGAAALAGSLLRIKPILALRDGVVAAWGKVRGKRRALQCMLEATQEKVGTGPSVRSMILHAASADEAEELRQEVQETLKCPAPQLAEISPVLGVHVGPGTVGVAAYNEAWL